MDEHEKVMGKLGEKVQTYASLQSTISDEVGRLQAKGETPSSKLVEKLGSSTEKLQKY